MRQTECLLCGTSRMFQYKSDLRLERIQPDTKQGLAASAAELLFSDKTGHAIGRQNAAVECGQFLLYTKLLIIVIIMFLKG